MNNQTNIDIESRISAFAKKYYFNIFLQRLAIFVFAVFILLLVFSFAEYTFWFGTTIRKYLFWTLNSVIFIIFIAFLLQPLFLLLGIKKQLSKKDFALVIGNHFPEIKDKILNIIELKEDKFPSSSAELINASISQKTKQISFFNFSDAINKSKTRKFLPFLFLPIIVLLLMSFLSPNVLVNPLYRISDYKTEYIKPAPFEFVLQNDNLQVAQNSNFTISVKIQGSEIPSEAFIEEQDGKRHRMNKIDKNTYKFVYNNIKKDKTFNFWADGFKSETHKISVFKIPAIINYSLKISYPEYTGKKNEVINNINSLNVPRGTKIEFFVQMRDADGLNVVDSLEKTAVFTKDKYSIFEKRFVNNASFYLVSYRKDVKISDSLEFLINVIPDEYPTISVEEKIDSSLFMIRYFNGKISDDYGLTKLMFCYKIFSEDKLTIDTSFSININQNYNLQEFYNAFDFSIFNINPGDKIEYFFKVYDNDSYSGNKFSKSQIFTLKMPTEKELQKMLDEKSSQVGQSLDNMYQEAESLQKELEDFFRNNPKNKKLSWEDKEKLKELIDREKELEENIKKASEENSERLQLSEKSANFNEQVYEKQKLINELLEKIMDEEFRELLDKIRDLLEKNSDNLNSQLEKLNQKNSEILKNLDQTIELLKRSKMEEDINFISKELKNLSEEQNKVVEKEKSADKINEQENVNKMFEELKQRTDSALKNNETLESPFPIDFLKNEMNKIDSTLMNATDMLNKSKESKAEKSQKDAADQMEELSEKLENMMADMEAEQHAEDLGLVREILKNLITASFQQEDLMKSVAAVRITDPKYFENMRKQKRLNEGLSIVQDSLYALGKRNPMINSYINDELAQINTHKKNAINALNNRQLSYSLQEQQYVIMHVNNLALLLSDALKQMQQKENQQKNAGNCKSSCKNPSNKPGKGKGQKPSAKTLRQLQEELNKQMESLKSQMEKGQKAGNSNPQWSEQFAKMAAQQEAIRKAMQEYQQQLNSEGANGSQLNNVIRDMEKTEEDLVNKRLSSETINRQKQIEIRLLESEKAEMEREKDPNRQSEEAKFLNNGNPIKFFKYNSLKKTNTEILKTVPPNLTPYYKQKVNEYLYKSK